MKIKSLKSYFLVSLLVCLFSCNDYPDVVIAPSNTLLVYISAENTLSSYATTNIDWMLSGAVGGNLKSTDNLLVYVDQQDLKPQLIQIRQNEKGVPVKQILKTYPEQNSASPQVMQEVLDEVFDNPKYGRGKKGLILWSHATAWLPSQLGGVGAESDQTRLRAFGQDRSNWMEIDELANVLSDYHFEYIIFDACYMASIEVAYALKDITDYIFAYPTEVLANGLPYHEIIKHFFAFDDLKNSLVKIAQEFYDFYDKQEPRSASVSIVKTAELEKLADISREILLGKEKKAYNVNLKKLQRLDYLKLGYLPEGKYTLYDFVDFMKELATADQYKRFENQLEKIVLHKATTKTAYFNNGTLVIDRFSGLSTYVPQKELKGLNSWYKKHVSWFNRVYR